MLGVRFSQFYPIGFHYIGLFDHFTFDSCVCFCFFLLVYVAYAHNITYCFVEGPDAFGSHYPRALFQTFCGIYLGEIVLLGIVVVGKGWGPIVIQVIVLLATIFAHVHLNLAFDHLLDVVPLDAMRAVDGVSSTASYTGPSEYESKVLNKRNVVLILKRVVERTRGRIKIKG